MICFVPQGEISRLASSFCFAIGAEDEAFLLQASVLP